MGVRIARTVDSPDIEHAKALVNEIEIGIERTWAAIFELADTVDDGSGVSLVDGTLAVG
jgi:hypothetical protein